MFKVILRSEKEPLEVSDQEGKALQGLLRHVTDGTKFVNVAGRMISVGEIASTKQVADPPPLALPGKKAVWLTPDGSVKARWCKKRLTRREYDRQGYTYRPGFYLIADEGTDAVVGFTRAYDGQPLPVDIEECTQEESDRLERRFTRA